MQIEIIGGKACFVGRGENSVLAILKNLFPEKKFLKQVPLVDCLKDKYAEGWRQTKESIDILMIPGDTPDDVKPSFKDMVAIRVQNEEDHKGPIKSKIDWRQRQDLEESEVTVVDITWHECKEIFKERVNYVSYWEVCNALITAGVKP